ncbi:MAG: anaerobic C4-dicarboxylate transporter [Deltaproteobacteria bacterium]|nr:anaerobic C4-dicarboxylate transporter [Deltaproteobacteria bacterium]
MLWIELALLLACILVGARIGGIGLGIVAGVGLACFVFLFAMPPGQPPTTVLGMILAVVTALAVMEAAGGLALVVALAERVLRGNPRSVTLLAPLVMYALIFMAGTQHVAYALLPVIAEVSEKAGVRPERPLSMSVIAAQHGLVASPISAATVALMGALSGAAVSLPQILLVIVPATLVGLVAGVASVAWRGPELADDPGWRARQAATAGASGPAPVAASATATTSDTTAASAPAASRPAAAPAPFTRAALGCCLLFLAALVGVVLLGLFPDVRPEYTQVAASGAVKHGRVEMSRAIMVLMLAAAGLMMLLFRPDPAKALGGSVMRGGLVAIVCILGVSWMGSSFFAANEAPIVGGIAEIVRARPWVFAAGLFVLSLLLFSQAAAITILTPVGIALGLPASLLVGLYPAVNGNFFLPTYGTVLAAVSFDRTGTTRIGSWVVNHSFMRPGLVTTIVATCASLAIARLVFG